MQLRFIDGTAKNSGQRLDNVYQTHLVLASGKLVRQKKILFKIKKKIFVTFLWFPDLQVFSLRFLFFASDRQDLSFYLLLSVLFAKDFFKGVFCPAVQMCSTAPTSFQCHLWVVVTMLWCSRAMTFARTATCQNTNRLRPGEVEKILVILKFLLLYRLANTLLLLRYFKLKHIARTIGFYRTDRADLLPAGR